MKEPCFALADPEEKPDHLLLSDQSTDDTGSDVVSVTSCRPSLEDCTECRLYRAAEGRRRVVFVRHGETDFNLAGKIQGTLESQLTEKGHAQARAAGAFLAADLAGAVDRVLCSPKARTMATLDDIEAAFATAGAALPERTVLEDLREIELTGWEGQCKKDIQRDDAAWQYLLDTTPPGTTTLVVAHGAFNRTFLARAFGLPISEYIDSDDGRFGFSNCGCAEIEWTAAESPCAELRWRRHYPEAGVWSTQENESAIAASGPEQAV